MEIPRVVVGLPGPQSAPGIAGLRVLDLDHFGAKPGERLGAGGPRLELCEINDPNAFETIQLHANSVHRSSLLPLDLYGGLSVANPPLLAQMMGFAALHPS